jgi:predicted XRE-type DNA-binding protein
VSKMSELFIEIQELIQTTQLSFQEIAEQLQIPIDMVYDVAADLGEFDE